MSCKTHDGSLEDFYIGDELNVPRKVLWAWVGDENNVPQLWWGGNAVGFVIFENGVFNHVPEGFDIDNYIDDNTDVTNLSEYYLTENLLWVHAASITTPWDVIGLNIDSQYFDYENQDILNAIYIPVNRIVNPEKLKITARGNFLVDIGYIDLEQYTMGLYSIDYLICDNNFHEYTINLSPNSIIDYIAIKNIEKKEQSKDTLINYDGEVNYFILPIHVHKNEISYDEINTSDQVYNWNFHVTEGNAYGLFIQNKNSSGSFHVCFFSGEPFTVEFLDRSTHRNMVYRVRNPYNYFSKEGKPFYCRFIFGTSYTEEHISNLSVDFTLYENSNIDALIIDQNSDPQLTVELGSIITSGFIEQDNSSIEQDPSNILSLQQISRIEVIGGTETEIEIDDYSYSFVPTEIKTTTTYIDLYRYSDRYVYRNYIPENCYGCVISGCTINGANVLSIIIISNTQFNSYTYKYGLFESIEQETEHFETNIETANGKNNIYYYATRSVYVRETQTYTVLNKDIGNYCERYKNGNTESPELSEVIGIIGDKIYNQID